MIIHALGRPITQGSKTRTRWGMRDDNGDRLRPWRDTVTAAAIAVVDGAPPIDGPVSVEIVFAICRPAGHYGTGRNRGSLKASAPVHPVGRNVGDIDKLCRAVLDSLTTAKVWLDDSQVVTLIARREYAAPWELEGAEIAVHAMPVVA